MDPFLVFGTNSESLREDVRATSGDRVGIEGGCKGDRRGVEGGVEKA